MYEQLAHVYDLIYVDWEASMDRQGNVLASLIPPGARVLDVAAGIGTQTLPLARRGYEVVARDRSAQAIRRLKREAGARRVPVDAATADMRTVGDTVAGPFDSVICFDNSLPHLLSDDDIAEALAGFRDLLAPEGCVLVSVRDYGSVERGTPSRHSYGERRRDGRTFRLSQEWSWYDEDHYWTTMIVEESRAGGWETVLRARARYYAIPLPRLLGLCRRAGLRVDIVEDPPFYQPVIRGRPL